MSISAIDQSVLMQQIDTQTIAQQTLAQSANTQNILANASAFQALMQSMPQT